MKRSTLLRGLLAAGLVGSALLEFVGEKSPFEHAWDYPLFFALMGAIGCIVLSVVAKGIVSPVLDREQDFYSTDAAEYDEIEAQFAASDQDADRGGAP